MTGTEAGFNHAELDALLTHAKALLTDGVSNAAVIDETGLEPDTVALLRAEDEDEEQFREKQEAVLDSAGTMNRDSETVGGEASRAIDSITPDIKSGTSPDSATTQLSSVDHDIAAQQQQAATVQAQQQQSMLQQQLSAAQQSAWQQAMQQQQAAAQVAQMNAMSQQQAMQQVSAQGDQVSEAQIRALIDELYADDASHSGGSSSGGIISGTEVDTDDLGGAENVSFEKTYPAGAMSSDDLHAAIQQAADAAGVPEDPHIRQQVANFYDALTQHEAGHNPGAANGWDSNAVGPQQSDGFPLQSSRGLAQCIPSTFSAYHVAGTSNSIYDPVASVAASINYLSQTYGVDWNALDGNGNVVGLAEFAAARGVDINSSDNSSAAWIGY